MGRTLRIFLACLEQDYRIMKAALGSWDNSLVDLLLCRLVYSRHHDVGPFRNAVNDPRAMGRYASGLQIEPHGIAVFLRENRG